MASGSFSARQHRAADQACRVGRHRLGASGPRWLNFLESKWPKNRKALETNHGDTEAPRGEGREAVRRATRPGTNLSVQNSELGVNGALLKQPKTQAIMLMMNDLMLDLQDDML